MGWRYRDRSKRGKGGKLRREGKGSLEDLVIDYNGDRKVMRVRYGGERWRGNI